APLRARVKIIPFGPSSVLAGREVRYPTGCLQSEQQAAGQVVWPCHLTRVLYETARLTAKEPLDERAEELKCKKELHERHRAAFAPGPSQVGRERTCSGNSSSTSWSIRLRKPRKPVSRRRAASVSELRCVPVPPTWVWTKSCPRAASAS